VKAMFAREPALGFPGGFARFACISFHAAILGK